MKLPSHPSSIVSLIVLCRLREQLIDPLFLSSTLTDGTQLTPSYQFLDVMKLPPSIRVVNMFRPFANVKAVVIQLMNVPESSKKSPAIDLCQVFKKQVKVGISKIN